MSTHITEMEAIVRNEFGKGPSRRLRAAGRIPAVIYGKDIDAPLHIHVDSLELHAVLRRHGSNAIIDFTIDGEKHLTMIKAVDQNVLTWNADHVDLLAIKRGETVEVEVPVVHSGEVAPGGMLMQDLNTLHIEADVLSIPEEIVVDVTDLAVGEHITAGDIKLPEKTSLVTDAETLVFNVVHPVEASDETETEGEAAAEGEESAEAAE